MAVSDEVWMMENAIYSILSPEGFASILYKDGSLAPQVADEMRITATDLKNLKVIEKIIDEPEEGIENNFESVANNLRDELTSTINGLSSLEQETLVENRYQRYRQYTY